MNIKGDINALKELHKDLIENKIKKKNIHYVDSIYFQQKMIELELQLNYKIYNKYLNKFYGDLYSILIKLNEEIPTNILKYNILYDSMIYTYDDIFLILKYLLEKQIISTNNIGNEFDFLSKMEDKESQGFYLTEFNTNLNYKLLSNMSHINFIFEKINYIINFQLKFANKFNNKIDKIASEVDIKYH